MVLYFHFSKQKTQENCYLVFLEMEKTILNRKRIKQFFFPIKSEGTGQLTPLEDRADEDDS